MYVHDVLQTEIGVLLPKTSSSFPCSCTTSTAFLRTSEKRKDSEEWGNHVLRQNDSTQQYVEKKTLSIIRIYFWLIPMIMTIPAVLNDRLRLT